MSWRGTPVNASTIDSNDCRKADCPWHRLAIAAFGRVFAGELPTMAVDTKLVVNRRDVHYESLSDFLVDAERQAAGDAHCLGNWSLAQIFDHLSRSLRVAVDGTDARFPGPARLLLHLIRKRFFSRPMKPGFHVPEKLERVLRPGDGLVTERSLQELRAAVSRFETAAELTVHPAFGRLTREEWLQLTLRHAELHMSFVVPERALP
jgi:hypothetical protein